MLLGIIALVIFFFALTATVKGWISQKYLPIQSTLILSGLLIIIIGIFWGKYPDLDEISSMTNFHPITATIAGFMVAGALKAAGGFEAAAELLKKAMKSFLGLPFSVILLVNLPTILALPCGRIIVSALIPVALILGYSVIKDENNLTIPSMIMIGLIVNAAASCGPSLIGGIGTLGEGMGHFAPGSFSDPQQLGIVVATVITMAAIKYFFKLNVNPRYFHLNDQNSKSSSVGYVALCIFLLGLAFIVIFQPGIPLQVLLLIITFLIMLIGRLRLKDLMQEILLHPLTAMIAGFIIAGILNEYGAFQVLLMLLTFLADHTPLGYIGIAILIMYLPIIFPLPCGRIIAISLIPGVLIFGAKIGQMTGNPGAQSIITIGFILAGAASCGPSPLGGIGCIGEGNLRLKEFASSKPQVFGIFLGMPVTCLLMSGLNSSFNQIIPIYIMLLIGLICGLATNILLNKKIYHIGGITGGLLLGLLIKIF